MTATHRRLAPELQSLLRVGQLTRPYSTTLRNLRSPQESIPEEILGQLDWKKPLENSVNSYDRHFAVSTGQYTHSK